MVQHVEATARSKASPHEVFALIDDPSTWSSWGIWSGYTLNEPGPDSPNGLGSVRTFHGKRINSKEKVVELVPDKKMSYVLVSGLGVRDYHATVELEPTSDGGTSIHWYTSFRAKVPGFGGVYRRALQSTFETVTQGLARYAEDHREGSTTA